MAYGCNATGVLRLHLKCSSSSLIQITRAVMGLKETDSCPEHQCCPENPQLVEEIRTSDGCLAQPIFNCDGRRECMLENEVDLPCSPFNRTDFYYIFYECIPGNTVHIRQLSLLMPINRAGHSYSES